MSESTALANEDVLGARSDERRSPLLEVKDLRVHFETPAGTVKAVDGVNWHVHEGETLAIVGESGSGKSVSAMTILGLVPSPPAVFPSGEVLLKGRSLLDMPENQQRKLRGNDISMIFQDPLTALNPVFKIGDQIAEMVRVHQRIGKQAAFRKAVDLLGEVGIPNPAVRAGQYPHEFSGGMRQRAMIAMALVNNPKLLIADEPTTALDVTVQAQILTLMKDLQKEYGSAIIIITHDLGVVADMADDLLVMYGGKPVETGSVGDVFYKPEMPYTWGLLSSMPRMDKARQERLVPISG
ncbi:ABC transporter ATP-binding protein, partial [Pseudonocardia sp.]|uniref:ABC transporter ATP-binding protein n=1 Tax=Pseudonocardia sp. TaxID=60912 RepID=UPI0031FD05A1